MNQWAILGSRGQPPEKVPEIHNQGRVSYGRMNDQTGWIMDYPGGGRTFLMEGVQPPLNLPEGEDWSLPPEVERAARRFLTERFGTGE